MNSVLWINIVVGSKNRKIIHLAVVYAPTATPATNDQREKIQCFYEELNSSISKYRSLGSVILVGDFNARLGEVTGDHATNRNKTQFMACLEEHSLINHNIKHCFGQ